MNAEGKIKKIELVFKKYRKQIDRALKNDCQITMGGNGINCCEANSVFTAIERDLAKILNEK